MRGSEQLSFVLAEPPTQKQWSLDARSDRQSGEMQG